MGLTDYIQICLIGVVITFSISCGSTTQTLKYEDLPTGVKVRDVGHRPGIKAMESQVFNLINVERAKKGLPGVKRHAGLSELARKHSYRMSATASRKKVLLHIDHNGFNERSKIAQKTYGLNSVGENVAANWGYKSNPSTRLVQDWMNSSKHRKNILKRWSYSGLGLYVDSKGAVYATQIFGNEDIF